MNCDIVFCQQKVLEQDFKILERHRQRERGRETGRNHGREVEAIRVY